MKLYEAHISEAFGDVEGPNLFTRDMTAEFLYKVKKLSDLARQNDLSYAVVEDYAPQYFEFYSELSEFQEAPEEMRRNWEDWGGIDCDKFAKPWRVDCQKLYVSPSGSFFFTAYLKNTGIEVNSKAFYLSDFMEDYK